MHLRNGISHLAVAARPAMPQMSEARDQMAAREESQAAGMFRAEARKEGFCFVSRGRCFDQSPDLISGDPAEQKKKQNRKAPNPRLVFSRAPVIQKKQKTKDKTSLPEQFKSARAAGIMNLWPCARHKHVKAPGLALQE